MNIIFLDIDGVLNSSYSYNTLHKIDKRCLKIFLDTLNNIQNINIVISSTWRGRCLTDFCNMIFANCPFDLAQKLLSYCHEDYATPRIKGKRGAEVNKWLEYHKISKYLIIDDNTDFFKNQNVLNTMPDLGFTVREKFLVQEYFNPTEYFSQNLEFVVNSSKSMRKVLNRQSRFAQKMLNAKETS